MASEIDETQRPQAPAQQPQPPPPTSLGNGDHSSAAGLSNGSGPKPNGTAQQPFLPRESETERTPLFSDDDNDEDDDNVSVASEPASEQIASPSVSSPPYWTHTHSSQLQQSRQLQSGHARAVSSASAESVLPPGAITLQDNERDDEDEEEDGYRRRSSNSSEVYGRDRNRACWARSVQVTDYVLVNGSATNIGAFVVWIIRVETLNGSYMNIRKRYSEFDDLRRRLVQTFPNFEAAVPVLPPKSVLNRFRSKFLEKRRAGLQYFLNCILLNPEFSGSPVLKEFLFS
ncbi:PX domain-containing protein ypt35 [Madurella fahalii]|uniref:Endosomal/vacuolar adapter protein YPT35 n=1 Tax=Madurella fahalii TaxID=1157608 RepID=A0ABQ0FXJ3_9PEZI